MVVPVLVACGVWFVATHDRLVSPPASVYLRDRQGAFLGEVAARPELELGYWAMRQLPPRVVAATLLVEDRRFLRHPGIDPVAVGRALTENWRSGRRLSGASTIAMQVARMQRPGSRTYLRKLSEATTALLLTITYGREAVLAQYLRLAPYGHRIHGIAYAARRYLNKPVDDLSWAETAFLTALPQAPARSDPYTTTGLQRARERGQRILRALFDAGKMDQDAFELARVQLTRLQIPPLPPRPTNALHLIARVEGWLRDAQRRIDLNGTTDMTVDLPTQNMVAGLAQQTVRELESRGVGNAAVLVVDRATNEVRAAVGSTGYFDKAHAGAFDYSRIDRSPGSTLKPFLFALGLERGTISPATILDDIQRPRGDIINADETFLGPLLPRVALANSRNVPAAALLARIGLSDGYAFLQQLGLHNGAEDPHELGLGLAIGALPVTLEHLVHAYTALARDGVLSDLVWLRSQPLDVPRRVLSQATARQITLFLADPMARLPTFPRMGPSEYPFPVALKTGTSSKYRDALTVAYSTRYVVGVWLGHPKHRPMSKLTAFHSAASLAQSILLALHNDQRGGLDDLPFEPPPQYHSERICALTGMRATPACGQVFVEWFRPGDEPMQDCQAHQRVAVDRRDGRVAGADTPVNFVQVRTVTTLPSRYAAWSVSAGYDGPAALMSRTGPQESETPKLTIVTPVHGADVMRDPDSPAQFSTIALRAVVDPPIEQAVWWVDGAPFATVAYPYTARWPLSVGEHTFQLKAALSPGTSRLVHLTVK